MEVRPGSPTYLFPVDHYSALVSNENIARTSKVLNYDEETGEIETLNNIYVPVTYDEWKKGKD